MILDKSRVRLGLAAIIVAGTLTGCAARDASTSGHSAPGKLVVTCTISTLCSLVAAVGRDRIELHGIVPVGASPETYEPSPSDVVAISHARLLFENGLGLEAWLQKLLTTAAPGGLTLVVLSDAIPSADKVSGNPHLWMDPVYAAAYVRTIESALTKADPANGATYRSNAARELAGLAALDRWIRSRIATVPADHRAMITFHDAWYYFDRRYGIKNVGAIEPSPGREPSPGYFAHLIALARENHVRAVFGEPQYSPKLATALQTSAGIKVFSNLYDDTLGTGRDVSTYDDMLRYDVQVIVEALRS